MALEKGLRDEFLAALREVNYRLTYEADEWGESREIFQELSIQMRCGTSRMITVLFGAHETKKDSVREGIPHQPEISSLGIALVDKSLVSSRGLRT